MIELQITIVICNLITFGFDVLIQLHGHVICNFKLHYGFQLNLKVSSDNICWFYVKHHVNLFYLLNYICHVIYVFSYNTFSAHVGFVNSVDCI